MSEQDLIAKAQQAVGSADTILAAAVFQPRGTSGGFVGGSAVGGTLGQALGGGIGGAIGNLAGSAIGMEEAKHGGGFSSDEPGTLHQVPWDSLVAVSASTVYGWRVQLEGLHSQPTEQLFALDRSEIAVTVHSRATVHTVEVADLRTHDRWEFEANRLNSHLKSLVAELHDIPGGA
jgi:hypothetical protein